MGRTNLHKMCFSHILTACVISGVIITREIIKKKIPQEIKYIIKAKISNFT